MIFPPRNLLGTAYLMLLVLDCSHRLVYVPTLSHLCIRPALSMQPPGLIYAHTQPCLCTPARPRLPTQLSSSMHPPSLLYAPTQPLGVCGLWPLTAHDKMKHLKHLGNANDFISAASTRVLAHRYSAGCVAREIPPFRQCKKCEQINAISSNLTHHGIMHYTSPHSMAEFWYASQQASMQ